jgi:hypothetical protein
MAKKKRTGIEWVGGIVSMPAYVTGEGDPYLRLSTTYRLQNPDGCEAAGHPNA